MFIFKSKEELFLTLMDERLEAFKRQMIDREIDQKGEGLIHSVKEILLIMAYLAGLKQSGKIDNGIDLRETSFEILIALDGFHWHKTIHSDEVHIQMVEKSFFSLLRLPLKEG